MKLSICQSLPLDNLNSQIMFYLIELFNLQTWRYKWLWRLVCTYKCMHTRPYKQSPCQHPLSDEGAALKGDNKDHAELYSCRSYFLPAGRVRTGTNLNSSTSSKLINPKWHCVVFISHMGWHSPSGPKVVSNLHFAARLAMPLGP